MMSLYRGQVYMGLALLFGVVAIGSFLIVMLNDPRMAELGWFALMCLACVSAICALVFTAFAYTLWVPKWERDEKRTGHVLGDERKK